MFTTCSQIFCFEVKLSCLTGEIAADAGVYQGMAVFRLFCEHPVDLLHMSAFWVLQRLCLHRWEPKHALIFSIDSVNAIAVKADSKNCTQ